LLSNGSTCAAQYAEEDDKYESTYRARYELRRSEAGAVHVDP
jgi:hypothetical protein